MQGNLGKFLNVSGVFSNFESGNTAWSTPKFLSRPFLLSLVSISPLPPSLPPSLPLFLPSRSISPFFIFSLSISLLSFSLPLLPGLSPFLNDRQQQVNTQHTCSLVHVTLHVLLHVGEIDPMVKFSYGQLTQQLLSSLNPANYQFKSYPLMGHSSSWAASECMCVWESVHMHLSSSHI